MPKHTKHTERRTVTTNLAARLGSFTLIGGELPTVSVRLATGETINVPVDFPADVVGFSWPEIGDPEVEVTVVITANFVVKS